MKEKKEKDELVCKLCEKKCIWMEKNNIQTISDWEILERNPKFHIRAHAFFNTNNWKNSPDREKYIKWREDAGFEFCKFCDDFIFFDFIERKEIVIEDHAHHCNCGEKHGYEKTEVIITCKKCNNIIKKFEDENTYYVD